MSQWTQWKRAPREQFSELRTPAAMKVADLVSRYEDLQTVRNSLHRLQLLIRSKPLDPVLAVACWAASITYYGRCFKTGKLRTMRREVVEELLRGEDEIHKEVLWRRDKEVSHAVDSVFDDVLVAAGWLPAGPAGFLLNSIANRSLRGVAPDDEFIAKFLGHVEILMERLAGLVMVEHKVLEDDVAEMATRGHVFQMDSTRFFLPDPGQPSPGPMSGSATLHTTVEQVESRSRRK